MERWVGSARRERLDRLRSSVAVNSSTSFASTWVTTTGGGHTAHSIETARVDRLLGCPRQRSAPRTAASFLKV